MLVDLNANTSWVGTKNVDLNPTYVIQKPKGDWARTQLAINFFEVGTRDLDSNLT